MRGTKISDGFSFICFYCGRKGALVRSKRVNRHTTTALALALARVARKKEVSAKLDWIQTEIFDIY